MRSKASPPHAEAAAFVGADSVRDVPPGSSEVPEAIADEVRSYAHC
ncbi:hypothetical protein J2T49_001183 [Pseudomonas nitroreducens]|nr:hypothetical protein [Pseudomonas nitroreducens]MCP1685244.1 hypothetical protein [Pseudomonas nitroreducens]